MYLIGCRNRKNKTKIKQNKKCRRYIFDNNGNNSKTALKMEY